MRGLDDHPPAGTRTGARARRFDDLPGQVDHARLPRRRGVQPRPAGAVYGRAPPNRCGAACMLRSRGAWPRRPRPASEGSDGSAGSMPEPLPDSGTGSRRAGMRALGWHGVRGRPQPGSSGRVSTSKRPMRRVEPERPQLLCPGLLDTAKAGEPAYPGYNPWAGEGLRPFEPWQTRAPVDCAGGGVAPLPPVAAHPDG